MVADFIDRTHCDLLAVSVGNVHGLCLDPQIDLPLLKRISEIANIPLVLHGGSGIPPNVIREAKKYGLLKINYGSDLRKVFIAAFGETYEKDHNAHDVIRLSLQAVENVAKKAQELVEMINLH
jgi:fructose/tagatose bisphosphate aldolase